MSSINPETVVSVLKDQIENYDQKTEVKEEGRIMALGELSTSIIRLPSNTAAHAASMEWTRQCMENLLFLKQVSTDLY